MALRRPLVRIAGVTKELPFGDMLPCHAFFSGSARLPLPAGLNIAYACVTAKNQVTIGFTAGVAIAGTAMACAVVALR